MILLHRIHCFRARAAFFLYTVAAAGGGPQLLEVNVIQNGTAEASATSWLPTGSGAPLFLTKLYGTPGWPDNADPGPPIRGAKFFFGGNVPVAEGHQQIELSSLTALAGTGRLRFVISGYLGGVADESDSARLTLRFLDSKQAVLGEVTQPGPSAVERQNTTGLYLRSKEGLVPVGTAFADVQLTLLRGDGNSNDGYADNLELKFVLASEHTHA